VQSALKSVKGVKNATVSFEDREAVVTYDPDAVKVEDLIKAVKEAPGMAHFEAKVKKSDTKDKPSGGAGSN
jgi:cation transport ATPase